jgi:PAS domain S-box-containing protein
MKNPDKIILIVADNPEELLVMEQLGLDVSYPYNAIRTSTINEARLKLQETTFHAVVSDYYLKDGIGTALVPALDGSPLIILIDEGNEDDAVMAVNAGAYCFLTKDQHKNYLKLLPFAFKRSIEQRIQRDELDIYRTQLENIVEERTNELIDMYSQIQESETNFRNIFNNTGDGFVITDYDFNFLEANNTLLKRFGVTKEFLATQSLIDFLVPSYLGIIYERLQMMKLGLTTGDIEIEVRSPLTWQTIPFEINTVPIVFNNKNAILTVLHDITERKSIARKLFETIIQTEEQERSRIARDLHDEIGPLISALKIYTTSFIEANNLKKKDKLAVQMGIIIRDVIESVKNISNDMSPHILVNFGLLAALQNIINLFSKNLEIQLSSNITDLRFPATVESVIYRIFKELVNNTVKHAKANKIFINIDYSDSALVCHFRDDGVGFDWPRPLNSQVKGMGISNIITRIQSLEGDFEIETEPGHGFEIKIVFQTIPADANDK